MDYQATLEKVIRHLFTQGRKAGDGYNCYYRAPDGAMCAVGVLIPDDQYDPLMDDDNATIAMVSAQFADRPFFNMAREHIDFLSTLQAIHDNDSHWISTDSMKNAVKWYFGGNRPGEHALDLSFMDELSFSDR